MIPVLSFASPARESPLQLELVEGGGEYPRAPDALYEGGGSQANWDRVRAMLQAQLLRAHHHQRGDPRFNGLRLGHGRQPISPGLTATWEPIPKPRGRPWAAGPAWDTHPARAFQEWRLIPKQLVIVQ